MSGYCGSTDFPPKGSKRCTARLRCHPGWFAEAHHREDAAECSETGNTVGSVGSSPKKDGNLGQLHFFKNTSSKITAWKQLPTRKDQDIMCPKNDATLIRSFNSFNHIGNLP